MHKRKALLMAASIGSLLTGCARFNRNGAGDTEWFVVEASPLDRAKLIYHPAAGNPSGKGQQTVDISGSGLLQLISGSSERALTSFWTDPEADNWEDLYTDRLFLQRDEITLLLQRLVDCGAFPKKANKGVDEPRPNPPYVILYTHIGQHKALQVTTDENILYIAELILKEFAADDN